MANFWRKVVEICYLCSLKMSTFNALLPHFFIAWAQQKAFFPYQKISSHCFLKSLNYIYYDYLIKNVSNTLRCINFREKRVGSYNIHEINLDLRIKQQTSRRILLVRKTEGYKNVSKMYQVHSDVSIFERKGLIHLIFMKLTSI